jgi:signal peptidase
MGAFGVTVLLFAAVTTPIGQWQVITDIDTLFRVGVGRYLPALTLSAVATSLTAGGGLLVSAAYRWPILTLQWLIPILPGYDWPIRALTGTVLPMVALIVARTLYEGTAEFTERYGELTEDEQPTETERSWTAWLVTAAVALAIVLFVNGAFGVRPYLLSGISMEPSFARGDVVIIREVPLETLEVNDVIRFDQSNLEFVHRLIEILEDNGELVFLTKGDNVDRPDPLVTADRVTGKVVFVLPKIGWPSLWIREALDGR